MKAVKVARPGVLELVEIGRRPLGQGEVRLEVEAVGICGSDVALWAGTHPYAVYPVIPGHEVGGLVIEATDPGLRRGQRVSVRPLLTCGRCDACLEGSLNRCPEVRVLGVHLDGGMAEEIVVSAATTFPVPERVPAEAAALVEPTAVAVHVVHRADLRAGDRVAVLGTGVIGLLCLQVAKAWGASFVLGVDREPSRLALASRFGADRVVDNRFENPAEVGLDLYPDGFDIVLDLVGVEETLGAALALARRGGTIVPVALPHRPVELDLEPFYRKELSLRATRLYADDFAEAVPLVADGRVDVESLVTHRFPLSEAERALSLPRDQPEQAVKVMIEP